MKTRRSIMFAGSLGVPLLACLAVAAKGAEVRGDDEISLEEQRALCPLCLPRHPCPRHVI